MIEFRANAKVNLFLRVVGLRDDGYHEIESVFHSVSLADRLSVEGTDTGKIEIALDYVDGRGPSIPPEANSVYRAALDLLARRRTNAGLRIGLTKTIPSGAGLGGGSSDAAATLIALNEMWQLGLTPHELLEIGAGIGSDVPFCLDGGAMLVTGRGERATPILAPEPLWLVLGISRQALLTRDVYRNWERGPEAQLDADAMIHALGTGNVAEVAGELHNDLEAPAFDLRPELPESKQAMEDAGALGAIMSGSGPTIVGVGRNESHAREIAGRLGDTFDRLEVVSTTASSVEPA